ncbi:hypothetical protein J6590_003711 [Homalodisca vitripennis]|nr:hypothetical protein J6590_003711 [Homalodisca vitripennis]
MSHSWLISPHRLAQCASKIIWEPNPPHHQGIKHQISDSDSEIGVRLRKCDSLQSRHLIPTTLFHVVNHRAKWANHYQEMEQLWCRLWVAPRHRNFTEVEIRSKLKPSLALHSFPPMKLFWLRIIRIIEKLRYLVVTNEVWIFLTESRATHHQQVFFYSFPFSTISGPHKDVSSVKCLDTPAVYDDEVYKELTCIYLACKICDYAVSIDMFVRSIGGDPRLMKFIILDQEIEVLYRLGFRLHISLPHRCIEEYMTQIRDQANLEKPEKLYYPINRFLGSMWFTDICLLYSPTLIALAAVMQGVSRCRENIDHFVNHNLLGCLPENKRKDVLLIVRDIRSTVIKSGSPPKIEEIAELEKKLAICRNPMNNPTSNVWLNQQVSRQVEINN